MNHAQAILRRLEDYQAWANETIAPITLLDFVGFVGTPDLLLGYAALFNPELVEHEGLLFLAAGFSQETYDLWQREGRTGTEIQRVMNHIHLSTFMQDREVPDDVAVECARTLGRLWARTLGPRGVEVSIGGETLDEAYVTFSGPAEL